MSKKQSKQSETKSTQTEREDSRSDATEKQ